MKTWLKLLGSLWFAVFLIASLAVILVVSTLLESAYGTPFVQRFFYRAGWFDAFLALLGVNIFCSALSRWPYKKQHTGFVVTHIGILILLAGSFLTRLSAVEGQMALTEGEAKSSILLPSENKDTEENPAISEGSDADPVNPAIQFTLGSELVGFHDTLWLMGSDPVTIGPATIELRQKKEEAAAEAGVPVIHIVQKNTGKEFSIDVPDSIGKEIPLGDTGLKLTKLQYFPDARVSEEKKLISVSDNPGNPAAEFDVRDAKGQKEFHTKFALFPDFESLHGKSPQNLFGLSVELTVPSAAQTPRTALLVFYREPNGKWSYESASKKGKQAGDLEAGKTYATGWMDFSFRAERLLNHALVNTPKTNTMPVPFRLALRDFRKVDYPGTTNAASYESDVTLEDPREGLSLQKTIKMNHPLDYKGWRIFQSSFSQDPELGESSVFTVAKNPGIVLIYSGSIVMFLGVVLVFYVKPFSSLYNGRQNERKR